MIEKTFICSCCNPTKSYVNKRALRKHQQKYDAEYVFGGETNIHRKRYDACPPKCKQCDAVIEYSKQVFTKTFCNRSCATKFNNNRLGTGNSPTYIKKRIGVNGTPIHDKQCMCGTAFRHQGKYCSIACCGNHRKNVSIEKWLNGEVAGHSGKTASIKKFVRAWVLTNSNFACSKCGWDKRHPVDGLPLVEIDHIDGDATNTTVNNLRVLCPNCHSETPNFRARNKKSSRIRK